MKTTASVTIVLGGILLLLSSCLSSRQETEYKEDRFQTLLSYLESEADYVNAPDTPFFINAPEVFENLENNYLIIDIRSADEFQKGHIQGAIHVPPSHIVAFLEKEVHAPGFEKITLVCNGGYKSAYVAMAARYLGYTNVFPLRNGLSSWNHDIASEYRLKYRSDFLVDKLVTENTPKNDPGVYPVLQSGKTDGYAILRERIISILDTDISDRFITINDWLNDPESFYLISYWPETRYNRGHLTGAIRYQPKASLRSDQSLSTLPADQPIIIQCFAGNHSNFATMYLNILGYDAKSMIYGANSFMYTIIQEEESPGSVFVEDRDIFHFPLVDPSGVAASEATRLQPQLALPDGGC